MFADAAWGLDIGSAGIRVLRLARRRGGYEITAVDRIDTYRDPQESTPEEMDAAFRKALSIFLVNHRVRFGEKLGVAIPGLAFETALLELPPVAHQRIDELVDYEVRNRFGARGDLCSGHTVLSGASVNERRVLVGVGPTGILGGYLDALQSAGIEADRVVLAPLALTDGLRVDGHETREAIAVRAGVGLTDFVLGTREGPIARTEPDGTLWIARTLRDRFGLSSKEADGERRAIEAREGNPRFDDVAAEYAERLASRVEGILTWHRGTHPAWKPHRILLAGEGAHVKGVDAALQSRFGVVVETHAKWNRVALRKQLFGKSLVNDLPALTVALGAAAGALEGDWNSFSLVKPNRTRSLLRSAPLVAGAALAFVAGVAVADQWVRVAATSAAESGKLIREVRESIAGRQERRALREVTHRRELSANKAWRVQTEWLTWEKATTEVLSALGPDAVILDCKWHRSTDGRQIVVNPVVGVPRPPAGVQSSPTPFWETATKQLMALGLRVPRLLQSRPVDTIAMDANESASPTADLYWLEIEVPLDSAAGVK